jgi:hypothetical protein
VRVDRPELAQQLVRLLQVPADRLVVLDGLADGATTQSAKRPCSSARVFFRRRR